MDHLLILSVLTSTRTKGNTWESLGIIGCDHPPCRDFDLGRASRQDFPGPCAPDPLVVPGGILASVRVSAFQAGERENGDQEVKQTSPWHRLRLGTTAAIGGSPLPLMHSTGVGFETRVAKPSPVVAERFRQSLTLCDAANAYTQVESGQSAPSMAGGGNTVRGAGCGLLVAAGARTAAYGRT